MPHVTPSKRLLLIEDDRSTQAVLTLMLERLGFQVQTAPDGEVGLRLFQENRYDLIVLDLLLPGLTGFDVAGTIRGHESDTHASVTPILALTASPLTETRNRSRAVGITEWAPKPISSFQLAQVVEKCLCSLQPQAEIEVLS